MTETLLANPMKTIKDLIEEEMACSYGGEVRLAHASIRYEALRRLGPVKFAALHERNLAGENFDGMVDQIAVHQANDKV